MGRTRKQRYSQQRTWKTYVTMYVEGETEKLYFSRLKQLFRLSRLDIVSYKGGKHGIVQWVEGHRRQLSKAEKEHNRVVILLDLDFYTQEKYEQIEKEAKAHGFTVFASYPNFEIWLLAHYEHVMPAGMNTTTIQQKIERHWGHAYKKTHVKIGEMADGYEQAVKNIASLKTSEYEQGRNFTNIDEMIVLLKSLCAPKV